MTEKAIKAGVTQLGPGIANTKIDLEKLHIFFCPVRATSKAFEWTPPRDSKGSQLFNRENLLIDQCSTELSDTSIFQLNKSDFSVLFPGQDVIIKQMLSFIYD